MTENKGKQSKIDKYVKLNTQAQGEEKSAKELMKERGETTLETKTGFHMAVSIECVMAAGHKALHIQATLISLLN
eukprot:15325773-Ditylum_brightwellii.AAC.1